MSSPSSSSDAVHLLPQPSQSASPSVNPQPKDLEPKQDPVGPDPDEECRLTDLFPNTHLPPFLNPMFADVKSPHELPLCWFGIPFSRHGMVQYAKNVGLDKPYTNGPWKGHADPGETWCNVCDEFRETTGIELDLKDVLRCKGLLLSFFSNWEVKSVTKKQLDACMWLIQEMGYDDGARPLWFLDRNNFL
ncbi:hypothetical protein V8D89_004018 [Ganoderma adspersum]